MKTLRKQKRLYITLLSHGLEGFRRGDDTGVQGVWLERGFALTVGPTTVRVCVCALNFQFHRLVNYGSHKYVFNEDTVLAAVKTSKETLYPNGYPGPAPTIPTVEEQGMMKEKVISQVLERVPGMLSLTSI